ncbi:CHASE2 domain-containing protein [Comamonas humi]
MRRLPLSRTQTRWTEWGLLALLLAVCVAWAAHAGKPRVLNRLVQDVAGWISARPASGDIAIVAIDDASLQDLGRWPWRRSVHARLIDAIAQQQPRAIGMDVLFNERDTAAPQEDALLAAAIARAGNVVLPVDWRMTGVDAGAELPIAALRNAARQLGHVNVSVDEDGVIRRYFGVMGEDTGPWPHFGMALLCAGGRPLAACRGHAPPAPGSSWVQRQPEILSFARGEQPYPVYSAEAVLQGRIAPDALRGKYVLVGATASGMGDFFATPARPSSRHIAGVELIAHALDAQLAGLHVTEASPFANTGVSLLFLLLALLAIAFFSPMLGLLAQWALIAALLLLSFAARSYLQLQLVPAAALLGLALIYPLWSWRRLSAAASFLQQEMQLLRQDMEGTPPPGAGAPARTLRDDFLDRRINAVESATQQLRQMHGFVSDTLRQIPSPTLVVNPQGLVTLRNQAASVYMQKMGVPLAPLAHIAHIFEDMHFKETGEALQIRDAADLRALPAEFEALDRKQQPWLVLSQPFSNPAPEGWLVMLVDLTELHKATEQRDQALRFISHDFRAPQSSIITLLEMERAFPGRMDAAELHRKIERLAAQSLDMAESFVQLASAQSQTYRREPVDLLDVLQAAVDDCWAPAADKQISVQHIDPPSQAAEPMLCLGDRALLHRSLVNLIGNAIKYSPAGTTVECSLAAGEGADRGCWVIRICDQGLGMEPEQLQRLFQPFQRFHQQSLPQAGGIGLGLSFVHTVVQRHQGRIAVQSTVGQGSCFSVYLPRHAAAPDSP